MAAQFISSSSFEIGPRSAPETTPKNISLVTASFLKDYA